MKTKPLFQRVVKFLAILFLVQILFLATVLLLAHRYDLKQRQERLHAKIMSLDPVLFEEIVFLSRTGNPARDMLIYEIIQKKELRFAAFRKRDELPTYFSDRSIEGCVVGEGGPSICGPTSDRTMVGLLPVAANGMLYGYLIQEARPAISAASPAGSFLIFAGPTLFLALVLNILGLLWFFRRQVSHEIQKLIKLIRDVEKDPRGISPPHGQFYTSECALIAQAIHKAFNRLVESERERMALLSETERVRIADQVAHDIRSPLSALNAVTSDIGMLPETHRILLRSAINRIHDIASSLLRVPAKANGNSKSSDSLSTILVPSLVSDLVSEKRVQNRQFLDLQIEFELGVETYGLFVDAEPVELKRVLSNIIDNSIESFEKRIGRVSIKLGHQSGKVLVAVSDNGPGIPEEVLGKIGTKGFSHGKEHGSGLGLYHAKECTDRWKGELKIESSAENGTTVTLSFPEADCPIWFVPVLNLDGIRRVVILDDDISIHQVWESRLSRREGLGAGVVHFSRTDEFARWLEVSGDLSDIYLIDYEFAGEEENGLSLIERLGINGQSILVTSRFEEAKILAQCKDLGIRLIPKNLAGFVPVVGRALSEPDSNRIDEILIETERGRRVQWWEDSLREGKRVKVYPSVKDFLADSSIPKVTPVYFGPSFLKTDPVLSLVRAEGFQDTRTLDV